MDRDKVEDAMRLEKGIRHAEAFLALLLDKARDHRFRTYGFDKITKLPCKVIARLLLEEHVSVEAYLKELKKQLKEL